MASWGHMDLDNVLGWRRAHAGVDLGDLASAAARYFTAHWEPDDWRGAKRGLSPRQRELLRDLADELAREWTRPELGDGPADTQEYARTLRREIPRRIRTMARAWRPAPREWPPRLLAAI
jgi:hypothetical protein